MIQCAPVRNDPHIGTTSKNLTFSEQFKPAALCTAGLKAFDYTDLVHSLISQPGTIQMS